MLGKQNACGSYRALNQFVIFVLIDKINKPFFIDGTGKDPHGFQHRFFVARLHIMVCLVANQFRNLFLVVFRHTAVNKLFQYRQQFFFSQRPAFQQNFDHSIGLFIRKQGACGRVQPVAVQHPVIDQLLVHTGLHIPVIKERAQIVEVALNRTQRTTILYCFFLFIQHMSFRQFCAHPQQAVFGNPHIAHGVMLRFVFGN